EGVSGLQLEVTGDLPTQLQLQGIIVRVSAIESLPQHAVSLVRQQLVKAETRRSQPSIHQAGELTWIGAIEFLPITEVSSYAANVGCRENSLPTNLLLNSRAELGHTGRGVVLVDSGHIDRHDRNRKRDVLPAVVRIRKQNIVSV